MCNQYWLEEGVEMFGQYEVSLQAMIQHPEYTVREFKMVDANVSNSAKTY